MKMDPSTEEAVTLVQNFFGGSIRKTKLWFSTPNPLLGNVTPEELIRMGYSRKVLSFIRTSMDENKL